MQMLGHIKVSDKIYNLINNNVRVHPSKPMTFLVSDHYCKSNRIMTKATQIAEWAEKLGAEVKAIAWVDYRLEIEISDPVAAHIEKHFGALN